MKWNRTTVSEWGCIVSGIVAAVTAIIWFVDKMPGGLWVPALLMLAACACALMFYLGKRIEPKIPLPLPVAPPHSTRSAPTPIPDASIKDSDPQLEIKVADLRGKTMSEKPTEQACFDLINRGKKSPANFACIEDFNIGGYHVAFRNFPPPIAPLGNHESVTPHYINKPDGRLCTNDIFTIFSAAWSDLKNPKLYEYVVQIKVTYQDDYRNLFEARCDLVFYPSENANRRLGQPAGPVLETKNHKLRKVAPSLARIDWD